MKKKFIKNKAKIALCVLFIFLDMGFGAFKIAATPLFKSPQYDRFQKSKAVDTFGTNTQSAAGFDTIYIDTDLLYSTLVHGSVGNDTIILIASSADKNNIPRHRITGKLFARDKYFSYSLTDSVLINYEVWRVSPNNNIRYSPEGILLTDFKISKDSAGLSALSLDNTPNSPINISFEHFNIANIAAIFSKDTLFAKGLANGQLMVTEPGKRFPAFTGIIDISDTYIMKSFLGNLHLASVKQNDTTMHTTISVLGTDTDISAEGIFYLNTYQEQFNATIDIRKFPLASLQPLARGYINRASGNLFGSVELKGLLKRPRWKGEISFDTASIGVSQAESNYTVTNQKVILDYPTIYLNQFTIKDTLDHPLVISGNLCPKTLHEYELDLVVNSKDFTLINAPSAINNKVYGYIGINTNASVTGTTLKPVITGDMRLNKATGITLVVPEKNIDKDAARSVVRFIDRDTFAFKQKENFNPVSEPKIDIIQYLSKSFTIQVDKEASLTIVIDPSTGDELKVKGEAKLRTGIGPGGDMYMAGTYLLDSGYYELNYEFLKKRFRILPGSTINFGGSAVEAQINIRGEYIADTSPKDLLGNEVGTVSNKIARSFIQKIPFRIILFLKGSLKQPEISFDIQLPLEEPISRELRTTIDNKLVQLRGDAASTNKQVFALLALDRFVGEQSTDFFKGNGSATSFSDIAKESVSKFLSAALDQIASDLFTGINVDLNLDSYQDFNTNVETKKTDLNVEVSKNFLNDRLTVTVGKNFGIESQDGSAKAAQQKGSRFLPDVTVNYKLSADGKYMIRSYTKNQFEVILDGYVIETGVAFIITTDYDHFSELFIKNKKNRR